MRGAAGNGGPYRDCGRCSGRSIRWIWSGFHGAYRLGGAGRAPYDPAMMVALLLYAYARGNRSSRGIERACREDVAFKVITGMRAPDHSTVAEFRRRHEADRRALGAGIRTRCARGGG